MVSRGNISLRVAYMVNLLAKNYKNNAESNCMAKGVNNYRKHIYILEIIFKNRASFAQVLYFASKI
jgi:hypothetical protein